MTPLLWMYYAFDSGTMLRALTLPDDDENDDNEYKHNRTDSPEREEACDQVLDMESSVLELALEEFPSCALLRLYHFDTVCGVQLRLQSRSSSVDPDATRSIEDGWRRVDGAFEEAIRAVGNGSHWNEDYLVVAFYNTYIRLLLHKTTTATTTTIAVRRRRNTKNSLSCSYAEHKHPTCQTEPTTRYSRTCSPSPPY